MRSDVKVGVICLFVLLLAVVGYFAWTPKGDRSRNVPRGVDPGLVSDPARPGAAGTILQGPSTPLADSGTHVTYGPGIPAAGTATNPAYASGVSTQPAGDLHLSGPGARPIDLTGPLPGTTTGPATRTGGGPALSGGVPTTMGRPDMPGFSGVLPPATAPAMAEYIVKHGDSLWAIAHANHITVAALASANSLSPTASLKEKQKLKIPPAVTSVTTATHPATRPSTSSAGTQPSATTVKVKAGDSLRKIAKSVYGDESKWKKIYDANKAAIGSDPNDLAVGTTLKIPQ